MGSRERAIMGLELRAISACVTKLIVTIYSKTCNKLIYHIFTTKDVLFTCAIQARVSCMYQDCIPGRP